MAFDPYSPCPCGSGKKFKWCCQPIYADIDRALRQHNEGQHEVALRIMGEVVAANPGNPEAHGRFAQLLYVNGKLDEAETALQKAFALNPNYPFGYYLRGLFRQNEGESVGALLLFRKAIECYDPQAHDMLAQVYLFICQNELKLNRPVAARAAMQLVSRYAPADQSVQRDFEAAFGEQSQQPLSARREYRFAVLPTSAPAARRQAWDRVLSKDPPQGRFSDAVRAFAQLTTEDATDHLAWYNLALAKAWLGDNVGALDALDRYVQIEEDEALAASAWSLGEVLRCGDGLENQADYVQHSFHCRIRDPQAVANLLNGWDQEKRMFGVQVNEETGVMMCCVLEPVAALTSQGTALQPAKLGAFMMMLQGLLQLWHTSGEALDRIVQEVQQKIGMALVETQRERLPVRLRDVLAEAVVIPVGVKEPEAFARKAAEGLQSYFEEKWIHRPLQSLRNIPPIDAAGQKTLRTKVLGVIQFLQECAALGGVQYDFDRLRRKLGLLEGKTADAGAAGPDFGALAAAELAALPTEGLSDDQLESAFQAALKLDAREVAGRFARLLVERPPRPEHPDRFPWFTHLVKLALENGDATAALNFVNEGESYDCTHNEGRRRNDYELRRGQILAKQGDDAAACEVFDRLIARIPDELRYRGSAAEAMLSIKKGAPALKFAEEGLAAARKQNNRDSEGHFLELVAAARRATGG